MDALSTMLKPLALLEKVAGMDHPATLAEIAEDEGGNARKAVTGDPKKLPARRGIKRRKKSAKKKVWHSKKRER